MLPSIGSSYHKLKITGIKSELERGQIQYHHNVSLAEANAQKQNAREAADV